jgi:hypothetical protein
MCRTRKRSRILARDHFLYGCLYEPKCLPVSARRQRVVAFAVFFVIPRAPIALPDLLDHKLQFAGAIDLSRDAIDRVYWEIT